MSFKRPLNPHRPHTRSELITMQIRWQTVASPPSVTTGHCAWIALIGPSLSAGAIIGLFYENKSNLTEDAKHRLLKIGRTWLQFGDVTFAGLGHISRGCCETRNRRRRLEGARVKMIRKLLKLFNEWFKCPCLFLWTSSNNVIIHNSNNN